MKKIMIKIKAGELAAASKIRIPVPPPTQHHRSARDYDRKRSKLATRQSSRNPD